MSDFRLIYRKAHVGLFTLQNLSVINRDDDPSIKVSKMWPKDKGIYIYIQIVLRRLKINVVWIVLETVIQVQI